MEHEERAEELEQDADKLDEHSDEVGQDIDEARREWEANEDDPTVPGAQPSEDEAGTTDEEDSSGA